MIAQPVLLIRQVLLLVLVVGGLVACASTPPAEPRHNVEQRKKAATLGDRAATIALRQVGAPYRYGGNSPSGFDCSGLAQFSYASVGKRIPRTTSGQWAQLAPVGRHEMQAGDLLFFRIAGKMSHVGIYLGGGRFVHAPSSGKTVSIESLGSDYYSSAFIRAGRP